MQKGHRKSEQEDRKNVASTQTVWPIRMISRIQFHDNNFIAVMFNV